MRNLIASIVLVCLLAQSYCIQPLRNVYVEYRLPNSDGIVLGVDVPHPRISWTLPINVYATQEAYQITVEHVLSGEVMWDSGIVSSEAMLHVLYEGKEIKSDSRYSVKVVVWTNQGVHTGDVQFHSGLMQAGDFTGVWIGSNSINMNQLRKEFTIPSDFSEATVFISGVGYYELFINGQNVDPTRKLDPGWTTFEVRTLYATFNVTGLLKSGTNAFGVLLGNGWYSQDQNIPPATVRPSYGPPRVILQLNVKLANGNVFSVVTDETWTGREGPILADSVYHGEKYDSRLERPGWAQTGFTDNLSLWINAEKLPAPGPVLSAQIMEPIRTDTEVKPVNLWVSNTNTWIVDFGQNMAGWTRYTLRAPKGATIRLRYAEILEQTPARSIYSNQIYQDNLRAAAQTDIYITSGSDTAEIFEPRFTVHGFRYVEITSTWSLVDKMSIVAIPVHSLSLPAGTFSSDNAVINQVQSNILWGQRSNLMSLPTDCCQRDERKGWMGDAALTVDEALFNFKLGPFYQSWAQNIRDIQLPNGAVGDTTPLTFGSAPADPAWGTAYPTAVYALYDHYNDLVTAADHYPNLQNWVDFLSGEVAKTGIGRMYYHYGDWVPPPPHPQVNQSLTSAVAYAGDVLSLSKLAGALKKNEDQQKYAALYGQIGQKFHAAFYNPAVKGYADGGQSANVLALSIDAVPATLKTEVVNSLLSNIEQNTYHLTTGILGAKALFPILSQLGHHDVALKIMTQVTYPSYGYMFNNPYENATTLWELMDAPFEGPGMNSRNHIMWGSVGAWFYRFIAGIKPNALEEIEISPAPVGPNSPVNSVQATYDSLKGVIGVNWKKTADSFFMDVSVPSGTKGRVVIPHHESPYSVLLRDGQELAQFKGQELQVSQSEGINSFRLYEDGSIELKVQPGFYRFKAVV